MFKWGKQTVVFKVGACLSGGFLSACHFESLVFSPCPCPCPFPFPHPPVPLLHWSALSVGCLPREVCTVPHHGNQLWLQTVVKLCTIRLAKLKIILGTSNGIYRVLFHLEYFALFHSQGICLLQGQSQVSNICMKSLTRWFYVMNTLPLLSYAWCTLVTNWVDTTSWPNF